MKFYVSGKITGLSPEEFVHNFKRGVSIVKLAIPDSEIVNPVEIPACKTEDCGGKKLRVAGPEGSYEHHWQCYMRHDLIELLRCDAIVLLPNWRDPQGAKFELDVAIKTGMSIWVINENYESIGEVFPA